MAVPVQFGLELELLLGHKPGAAPFADWTALARDVHRRLAHARIANHVQTRTSPDRHAYTEWCLVREMTIRGHLHPPSYGIELVSPVYSSGSRRWLRDLGAIFAVLHEHYTVYASGDCSTHVHVSTRPTALTEAEACRLAEAVLYYEAALDALLPPARTAAYWARSNRASHMFAGGEAVRVDMDGYVRYCHDEHQAGRAVAPGPGPGADASLDTCLGIVRSCFDQRLFAMDQAVNLVSAASAYGRVHGKTADFVRGKTYKWNFASLYQGKARPQKSGTVEFRLPPGSVCAQDAEKWVALATAFFAGVLAGHGCLPAVVPEGGASLEELVYLLEGGRQALGWATLGDALAVDVEAVLRGLETQSG